MLIGTKKKRKKKEKRKKTDWSLRRIFSSRHQLGTFQKDFLFQRQFKSATCSQSTDPDKLDHRRSTTCPTRFLLLWRHGVRRSGYGCGATPWQPWTSLSTLLTTGTAWSKKLRDYRSVSWWFYRNYISACRSSSWQCLCVSGNTGWPMSVGL